MPLASIEPEDNSAADEPVERSREAAMNREEALPSYQEKVEPAPANVAKPTSLAEPELDVPLDDDDLDVPAFIRRKVE
jgi:hypothetical protein